MFVNLLVLLVVLPITVFIGKLTVKAQQTWVKILDGKQVRVEVEAEMERLLFAPWTCLNESVLEELASLASQLRDGLKK
ncbi:MAG: hypothetical protein EDM79_11115 [Chloroflexi bacterium]|nr:MAG: hypothetical protein EDM79_11115 [Chloroflexota bacterium]MCE7859562.1 hypothetical protein [Chloroflexi bacterium CFX2]